MAEIDEKTMTLKECINLINADRSRFENDRTGKIVSIFVTSVFRIGSYLASKKSIIAYLPYLAVKSFYFIIQMLTGIQLPLGTSVRGGCPKT